MSHSLRIFAIPLLLAGVGLALTTGCPNPTPVVSITSEPPGATVILDGEPMGTTPWQSDVVIGRHRFQVTLEGYRPWEQDVTLQHSQFYEFHAVLVPLQGTLEVNVTPAGAAVTVDDAFSFARTPCRLILPAGEHRVTVTAPEHQPHTWTVTLQDDQVTRLEGTLAPLSVSPSPEPTASPTPSPTPQAKANPTPVPTQAPAVRTWETTISIPTYQYEDALYPADNIPYPRLDFERVGPPVPTDYRAVVVENRYLQLTFLPDLGGRLYRCVFKPTGHDVFYRNPVIKPTHWGPDEMGWWIAAGGMEWCFPVWEHGYTTALPWQCQTRRETDGSVTFIAEDEEETTGLHVSVAVTLRPDRGDLEIRPTVSNSTGQSQTYKLWINALLGLEADRLAARVNRFCLPVSEVVVHSTGDATLPPAGARMSWPVPNGAGRDFSYYINWNDYLGVFAAPPAPTWAGVYNVAMGSGIVRVRQEAPPTASGVKIFAFGPNQDPAAYTDGDSWYCELWSGSAPDFDQAVTIAPGASHTWTEWWYPVGALGGLDQANERAALHLDRGMHPGTLVVGVAAPARQPGTVVVLVEGAEIYRTTLAVPASPGYWFATSVSVPDSVPAAGLVTLRFLDDRDQIVAQIERWMAVR